MQRNRHPSLASQYARLEERKQAERHTQNVCGVDFLVMPGVYGTSVDTELMAETVQLSSQERFFEIGCGTGAVSLLLAARCQGGRATDINPLAIENARMNAASIGVTNVAFAEADGFGAINEMFDVLICNPPYNNYPARDEVDRMFWDPEDHVKELFFREAKQHLFPNGRLYFGWADFADIDADLPLKLAERNGFVLTRKVERLSHSGKHCFSVWKFGGGENHKA